VVRCDLLERGSALRAGRQVYKNKQSEEATTMNRFTKRSFLSLGAGATISAAAGWRSAVAQALPPHEQELYEAAKREGEITWYSGQYAAEPSEAVGRAFSERYPGVRVNVVRSTSQVAFQRLSQDMRAGIAQCDVFSSTDSGHYHFLKREEKLMQFRPHNADGLLEAIRHADPDNYFQTFYLGLYQLAYNTQKVKEADAPKTWQDVLDPKWRNQLAVGHPGFSGAIGIWAVLMRKMYTWDYFKKLERNRPQIGRSSQDPVTLLNAGERSIGVAIPSGTTLLSISRGNPLKLVYPTDGTVLTAAPSAIIRNAPHPSAAKLFMEFATGPGLSSTVRTFFSESVRPDVPPPEGARPLDQIKLISPTPEEAETGVPEVREMWRDTFGV
jgi:iron(III) transport system substrate-binding protein